jgi:hypothetical protein
VPVPPAALCPFRRSGTLATLTTSQEPNGANDGRHGAELPLIHHMLTVAPGELNLTLGRHKIALAYFIRYGGTARVLLGLLHHLA